MVSLPVSVDISLQLDYNPSVLYLSLYLMGRSLLILSQNIKDLHFSSHSHKYEYSFCEFYNKEEKFPISMQIGASLVLTLSMQRFVQVKGAVHVPMDYYLKSILSRSLIQ